MSESGGLDSGLLDTRLVRKVWGRAHLPEPFASQDDGASQQPIGEIWFKSPSALDDILVKYLFTSDKLSVQVHPSDAQARPGEEGKEECWLILDAEPGAQLAIGFRDAIDPERMRAAAIDGSIEDLLQWHTVAPGDFFYLPAGTVHAIGAGISLVEVQQSSDTTFRLYDYGRPRELHLDRAVEVARCDKYNEARHTRVSAASEALVAGPHFRLTRLVGVPAASVRDDFDGPVLVLPLSGEVGLGDAHIAAGHCGFAPSIDAFRFADDAIALLVAGAPS